LDSDLQAQVFESFNKIAFQLCSPGVVEVICSQVMIGLFGSEYMVDNHPEAMGDRYNGALLSLARG
jgi:hypothetical protein